MTPKAASRLVEFMKRNWQPNDILLGQTWRTGLNVCAVSPSPIRADMETESTIGNTRFHKKEKTLKSWEKAAYPFTRAAYKLWENAGKRWVWMKGEEFHDRRP